jgi:hypothetical protein
MSWFWQSESALEKKIDDISSDMNDIKDALKSVIRNQKVLHSLIIQGNLSNKSDHLKIMRILDKQDEYVEKNIQVIRSLVEDVLLRSYPRPMVSKITAQKWENNMSTLVFDVSLPPKAAPDVAKRLLTVVINGSTEVLELLPDASVYTGLQGPQDASVSLSLVDLDDAGNSSPPSELAFVLLDTVPPPQPGMLGVSVTAEIFDEPPAEEPPAEEPPAEEPPAEEPPVLDPPAEEPPAEDPPAEDPPAEEPPVVDPPAEEPPTV